MSKFSIITAEEASLFINNGDTVGISGFTASGCPKLVTTALANRAKELHNRGHEFKIGLVSGASTGDSIDGVLARANAIKFRTPYQANKDLRELINKGYTEYFDLHLSNVAQNIRNKSVGEIDVAIIEVSEIRDNGEVVLTSSVGVAPTLCNYAKKIIIELNSSHPSELRGIHDIYEPKTPPYRDPIPIFRVWDRAGVPYIKIDPNKILGVVESNEPNEVSPFTPSDETTERIGNNVASFLARELSLGKLPENLLPIQSGVGNIANAVLAALGNNSNIPVFRIYTEVIQDAVINLMEKERVSFASGCSLTVSQEIIHKVYNNLEFFKKRTILRPQEISNSPEVITRLGVISINTALEADIFGNINSTHIQGTKMMNGIGGSADFTRNAHISIFTAPSIGKNGTLSSIVPMVSHLDHSEHSVDVLVTDIGVADLRGKGPMQRAETIIKNCVHNSYKQLLFDYIKIAEKGHIPHNLYACFEFHRAFKEEGDMKKANWSRYS